MSYSYEVTVDEQTHAIFHVAAVHVLEGWGFKPGLHVPSMRGSGVTEYHRDNDVVTFSDTREPHNKFRLVIFSDTVEVVPLMASIIENAVAQLTSAFWASPLSVTKEELAAEVGRAVRYVWERTRTERGHAVKEPE